MSATKRIYEHTLALAPPLVPTGAATALARVERLAIEPHPEVLRVIRVGEAAAKPHGEASASLPRAMPRRRRPCCAGTGRHLRRARIC